MDCFLNVSEALTFYTYIICISMYLNITNDTSKKLIYRKKGNIVISRDQPQLRKKQSKID